MAVRDMRRTAVPGADFSHAIRKGSRTVLNRIVLALLMGVVVCGCADAPIAKRDDNTKSATSPQPPTPPQPPDPGGASQFRGARDALANGPIIVDVMKLVASPRADELADRIVEAASQDPDWWREHMKKCKGDEPPPYDPRMGISAAEHQEFVTLSKMLTAQKSKEAVLNVTAADNDRIVLDGGSTLPELTGIEIDLRNSLVRTPLGDLIMQGGVRTNNDHALGTWDGMEWKLESTESMSSTGTSVSFALGRMRQSGRGVIRYDARQTKQEESTRVFYLLFYDFPSKPGA